MHCPAGGGCADRSHGSQFSHHIEDIHHSLDDYVSSLEKEWTYRQQTISQLEQSELFYDIQYGEAKIVANVSLTLVSWHGGRADSIILDCRIL